jgi:hypothetical protein
MTMGLKHENQTGLPGDGTSAVQFPDWDADHVIDDDVDFDGNKATGLAEPEDPGDAATKGYADAELAAHASSTDVHGLPGDPDLIPLLLVDPVDVWEASHAYAEGDRITFGAQVFEVQTGGTSDVTIPDFDSVAPTNTIGDNEVTWVSRGYVGELPSASLILSAQSIASSIVGSAIEDLAGSIHFFAQLPTNNGELRTVGQALPYNENALGQGDGIKGFLSAYCPNIAPGGTVLSLETCLRLGSVADGPPALVVARVSYFVSNFDGSDRAAGEEQTTWDEDAPSTFGIDMGNDAPTIVGTDLSVDGDHLISAAGGTYIVNVELRLIFD